MNNKNNQGITINGFILIENNIKKIIEEIENGVKKLNELNGDIKKDIGSLKDFFSRTLFEINTKDYLGFDKKLALIVENKEEILVEIKNLKNIITEILEIIYKLENLTDNEIKEYNNPILNQLLIKQTFIWNKLKGFLGNYEKLEVNTLGNGLFFDDNLKKIKNLFEKLNSVKTNPNLMKEYIYYLERKIKEFDNGGKLITNNNDLNKWINLNTSFIEFLLPNLEKITNEQIRALTNKFEGIFNYRKDNSLNKNLYETFIDKIKLEYYEIYNRGKFKDIKEIVNFITSKEINLSTFENKLNEFNIDRTFGYLLKEVYSKIRYNNNVNFNNIDIFYKNLKLYGIFFLENVGNLELNNLSNKAKLVKMKLVVL